MKKLIFLSINLLLCSIILMAGAEKTGKEISLDPNVRYGILDNGMTYYIRSNDLPEDRADFYIVFNVGAILENDDQDGLAHLTEHMAFNGTKNFPKKGVLDFLERNGVAFGHNVNAFTSLDVTAYNLNDVPVTDESVVDTSLLILHDWSNYVAFEDEEIDAERKVVHEEWRTRRSADFRMMKELMPVIYKGSRYAERDVIGSLDVIDNCTYETLRSFYRDWYRPDLEALIIVGDFDADVMEKKVIDLFSKVPKAVDPKDRPVFEVPNNKEPLIGIATDPEAQRNMVQVYFKHDITEPENKDFDYMRELLIRNLYNTMINTRLNELVQKENPPFIVGYSAYTGMTRSKDAFTAVAFAKDNEIPRALTSVLEENERVRQHGFTQGEFDRAKKDILRGYEKSYKEKDNMKNNQYVWEYFSHFLTNEPSPGVEFEYEYANKMIPTISLEEINSLPQQWITDENVVISITGLENDEVKLPEEKEVLTIIEEVKNSKLDPYIDAVSDKPLIAELPKPGTIENTDNLDELGVTVWTFDNGAQVIVKPTDYKEDEILFEAYSYGGSSLLGVDDLPSADMTTTIISQSGVSDFDNISLNKMMAGKVVQLSPYLSDYTEGFRGATSPQDLETFMQLLYSQLEKPRFDETAYNAFLGRIKAWLKNTSTDPRSVSRDSISFLMADRNVRKVPMNVDKLNKVEFDRIKNIYSDRFKDGTNFRYYFVGNIDLEKFKPLAEQFIGGLKTDGREEMWKDNNVRPPADNTINHFNIPMETPKATVFVNYNGKMEYNAENIVYLSAIRYILSLRYTETIREDEGGTYGVGVWTSKSKIPYESFRLNMQFDCDPERAEHLKSIVYAEVDNFAENGPKEIDVHKTIEYFIKTRQENLKENRFWLNTLVSMDKNDLNMIDKANYEDIVKGMTVNRLQKFANKLFADSKNVEIVMFPETE